MTADDPSGDFGARLRQARERKGVSLRTISDDTKISMAALEALERNDVSRLPGGIFSRAFVRAFAAEVGLDPEATVTEFVRQFPHDSVTNGHQSSTRVDAADPLDGGRRAAVLVVKIVAFSVPVAALLVYLGMAGRGVPRSAAPPGPAPDATPAASGVSPDGGLVEFEPITIEVVAIRACALSSAIDGQEPVRFELKGGERRSFDAEHELRLQVSDAGAIEWLINGSPGRPVGAAGEPATVRVTVDNYREFLNAR